MNPRTGVMLVALVLWGPLCTDANAQKVSMSPTSIKQQVLSLNFTNNGQHVRATVGQQIEITLGTEGPAQYGIPLVSSTTVRLAELNRLAQSFDRACRLLRLASLSTAVLRSY